MTAEELEKLKQEQRQATRGGNLAELNRINKIIFDEREKRQKAKERTREQEREKVLSARISAFCEKCFLPFLQQLQIYFKEIKNGIYWD